MPDEVGIRVLFTDAISADRRFAISESCLSAQMHSDFAIVIVGPQERAIAQRTAYGHSSRPEQVGQGKLNQKSQTHDQIRRK
jgi:hypothetical protein